MFPSCWPRTVHAFALAVATLFAQGANAQVQPQCTLTAVPAIVSAGASSTLTASCSPAATSFEWSGGTCTGVGSTCTVTPSVTTAYSVIGTGTGGTSTAASAAVFTAWPSDGIYQWDPEYFLSVHRIGADTLIGTIYWVYKSSGVKIGTRTITEADTFDLLSGKIVDSSASATVSGTRFFRACALSYDLKFNSDTSLTVTRNSVSNSTGVSLADLDCAAKYSSEALVRTVPKIIL